MKKNPRAALTLVELLVVLVILAVVTIIAVQSTDFLVDQSRYNATQQTLQNIQSAIIGPNNQVAANGSPLVGGFVADMGRLPTPVYSGGTVVGDPLRELWDPLATAANLGSTYNATAVTVPSTSSTQTGAAKIKISSTVNYTATIPCGWRGPYLQLAPGTTSVLDGWGNPLQSIYQAPGLATYPPLTPPALNFPVNVVMSFGSDNASDIVTPPASAYAQDQYVPAQTTAPPTVFPLINFSQLAYGTVAVTVQAVNPGSAGTTPAATAVTNPYPSPGPTPSSPAAPPTETTPMVRVVLFAPVNGTMTSYILDSTSGITSLPAAPYYAGSPLVSPADFAINPAGATSSTPYLPATTPVQGSFYNVPIGPRAIQAFQYEGSTTSSNYMVITKRSPLTYLTVTPNSTLTPTLILQ